MCAAFGGNSKLGFYIEHTSVFWPKSRCVRLPAKSQDLNDVYISGRSGAVFRQPGPLRGAGSGEGGEGLRAKACLPPPLSASAPRQSGARRGGRGHKKVPGTQLFIN